MLLQYGKSLVERSVSIVCPRKRIFPFKKIINKTMTLWYTQGFTTDAAEPDNIIGIHDLKIQRKILNQLHGNDCLIDTTWIKLTDELKKVLETCRKENKRIYCYSGPDWDNYYSPPNEHHLRIREFAEVHNALKEYNVTYIGNRLGQHYFSFWVDFVYENLSGYTQFDPYNFNDEIKPFMCLNRKPHRHRVELTNLLEKRNLSTLGHVSIGGERVFLQTDIINPEGDKAVSGDIGITNDISTLGHPHNWNSHFLNVVTETTTYSDVFITEKTLKPILGKRPFIILGDYNLYKLLQDWGFDTFDDLFGTGYNTTNYEKRIDWIINVITDIVKENNFKDMLNDLKPRLEHNYENFIRIAKINRKNIDNLLDK